MQDNLMYSEWSLDVVRQLNPHFRKEDVLGSYATLLVDAGERSVKICAAMSELPALHDPAGADDAALLMLFKHYDALQSLQLQSRACSLIFENYLIADKAALVERLTPLNPQLMAYNQPVEQVLTAFAGALQKIPVERLKHPAFAPYRNMVEIAQRVRHDLPEDAQAWNDKVAELAPELRAAHIELIQSGASDGAAHMRWLHMHQQSNIYAMRAEGYRDGRYRFERINNMDPGFLDGFYRAVQEQWKTGGELSRQILALGQAKALSGALATKTLTGYSREEAKEITLAAFDRMGPEIGAMAREAFDKGWVLATEHQCASLTYVGSVNVPPMAITAFDGTPQAVATLAHEVGHVVQNRLTQQAQPQASAVGTPIIQEIFSHMAQEFANEEMFARAKSAGDRLILRLMLDDNSAAMSMLAFAKLEEALYSRVGTPDYPRSYKQVDAIFKGIMHEVLGLEAGSLAGNGVANVKLSMSRPYEHTIIYPLDYLVVGMLKQQHSQDPQGISQRLLAAMQAGNSKSYAEILDDLLGKDVARDPELFANAMNLRITEMKQTHRQLDALPEPVKRKSILPMGDHIAKRFEQWRGR